MRLSGLASGMDTESMIKELMKAERVKVDKVFQEKQVVEWRQDAYNNLNKDLANFILKSKEDLGLMSKNSIGTTYNSSYKNATWVKKTTSSDDSKLTATANSDSMNGVHTIKMAQLAKGASVVSSSGVTKTGGSKDFISNQIDGLNKDQIMQFTVGGSKGNVTFIIGDGGAAKGNESKDTDAANNIVRINKNLSEVSLKDIVSKINNATVNEVKDGKVISSAPLGIQAGYDSGLDKFFIKTKSEGAEATLSISGDGPNGSTFINALKLNIGSPNQSLKLKDGSSYVGVGIKAESKIDTGYSTGIISAKTGMQDVTAFKININGTEIDITGLETMAQIATEIDKISGLNASFVSDKLVISVEGANKEIKISSSGTDAEKLMSEKFLNSLNLNVSTYDKGGTTQNGKHIGTNAVIESYQVDGMEFIGSDKEYESNNFTINGVNFSAKTTGESSVTISSNTDEILNKIKEFVEGYNIIVDKMNSLVGQKRYSSFQPLTDKQKEAMSDKEVELWEAKAKSGLLKGDDIISRSIQKVRSGLYSTVQGATGSYNHLTNVGISTEKYVSGSMGGKLVIDELELRKQIENDASGVMDLLFKQPEGDLSADDSNLSSSKLSEKRAQSGIITRIYDNLAAGMKDIVDKSGLGNEADILRKVRAKITSDFVIKGSASRIDKQINQFNVKMESLNQYLSNKENFYYRKFSAMEQAMQRASAQSGWLSQQSGGGM